jgi:hypothetical protein
LTIESTGVCYVGFYLSNAIGFESFNPDNIEATGMFVDADGNPTTSVFKHNLDDATSETKWIIIQGCNFDP